MSTDIENWVKIRVVLDMIAYNLSLYKNGRVSQKDTLKAIRENVAEVFGANIADEIHNIIENMMSCDTGEILRKAQEFLVKKVIEGRWSR